MSQEPPPSCSCRRSNSPAMRFSAGRQRLPRMRPSTLAFMWQITYGFIFVDDSFRTGLVLAYAPLERQGSAETGPSIGSSFSWRTQHPVHGMLCTPALMSSVFSPVEPALGAGPPELAVCRSTPEWNGLTIRIGSCLHDLAWPA